MHDNSGERAKEYKKMLKDQFGINVEEEIDEFEDEYKQYQSQSGAGDDEECEEIELERTYIS